MRVVEPGAFKHLPKKSKSNRRLVSILLLFVLVIVLGGTIWKLTAKDSPQTQLVIAPAENQEEAAEKTAETVKPTVLKTFTAEQFKELYRSMKYPNTISFTDMPEITGTVEADNRIRQLAEAKGYQLTSLPAGAIVKINEPRLDGDDLLQPLAAQSWASLKEAAGKSGMPLSLVSAYRSPEYQKQLFTSRLFAQGVTVRDVTTYAADAAINRTLTQAAIPGYSRHHTGYTIDLWCEDGSGTFLSSRCFKWISANNYEKAKQHGWIPSYPDGATEQGPEPEPWEYVWVGTDVLYE